MATRKVKKELHPLQRKLLREAGIAGAALAVLAGIVMYLGSVAEDALLANDRLRTAVNQLRTQKIDVQNAYDMALKDTAIYEAYLEKEAANRLSLNRELMRDAFDRIADRYHLDKKGLSLNVTSPRDKPDPSYRKSRGAIIFSDVTTNFEAVSDEDVFDMLRDFPEQLSGSQRIIKLSLSAASPPSNPQYRAIAMRGFEPLVKGEMKFEWLGIRRITPNVKAGNAAEKKP